jgi:hypothetical protein
MTFEEAWTYKQRIPDMELYGVLKRSVTMRTWNGRHPVEENSTTHVAAEGTKVRIWMVSRFGDIGVTDNLKDPYGYDARIDPEDVELCADQTPLGSACRYDVQRLDLPGGGIILVSPASDKES